MGTVEFEQQAELHYDCPCGGLVAESCTCRLRRRADFRFGEAASDLALMRRDFLGLGGFSSLSCSAASCVTTALSISLVWSEVAGRKLPVRGLCNSSRKAGQSRGRVLDELLCKPSPSLLQSCICFIESTVSFGRSPIITSSAANPQAGHLIFSVGISCPASHSSAMLKSF